MFKFLRKQACRHHFYGYDLEKRDDGGMVSWPCAKCGKVFKAKCGLDILRNGKAMGGWGMRDRREKQNEKRC